MQKNHCPIILLKNVAVLRDLSRFFSFGDFHRLSPYLGADLQFMSSTFLDTVINTTLLLDSNAAASTQSQREQVTTVRRRSKQTRANGLSSKRKTSKRTKQFQSNNSRKLSLTVTVAISACSANKSSNIVVARIFMCRSYVKK